MTMSTVSVPAPPRSAPEVIETRAFLERVLPPPRNFTIRLWDGTEFGGEEGTRYTIVVNRPGAVRRMLGLPLELRLGEALIYGDFDIEGDLYAALDLKNRVKAAIRTPAQMLGLLTALRRLPRDAAPRNGLQPASLTGRPHSRARDRSAIRYHYDVGNDFYALWLDRRMVYTCAYFPTGSEDIDTAQELKFEYVCRKLRLAPGETLLDVGCGWGSFSIYAAERHGVRALGVTLSEQQSLLANQWIEERGLQDRVEVRFQDYRDVEGSFDKVAAIGILEHIGHDRDAFFRHVYGLLKPGGLFLNHAIGTPPHADAWKQHDPVNRWLHRNVFGTGLLRDRYVFPDSALLTVSDANLSAEHAGFEVRDVENLREHYAMTARHWVDRMEANRDAAVGLVGEEIYRIWRLYLTSAAVEFEKGTVNLNQTLFLKPIPDHRSLPLSRADLYRD
jgi:cyclopropane-fatty-acyl-phospholipid synthase